MTPVTRRVPPGSRHPELRPRGVPAGAPSSSGHEILRLHHSTFQGGLRTRTCLACKRAGQAPFCGLICLSKRQRPHRASPDHSANRIRQKGARPRPAKHVPARQHDSPLSRLLSIFAAILVQDRPSPHSADPIPPAKQRRQTNPPDLPTASSIRTYQPSRPLPFTLGSPAITPSLAARRICPFSLRNAPPTGQTLRQPRSYDVTYAATLVCSVAGGRRAAFRVY
jgi:hypothetical protein